MLRDTKEALKNTGLSVLDIEVARIADDTDVKSYFPALDTAAELGARNVISSVWSADQEFVIDSLGILSDYALPLGITVNIEFVTWSNAIDLKDAVHLIRLLDRPNVGLLVDTLHFYRSGVQASELETLPQDWFHMVHLCDAPKEIPYTREELARTGREARLDPGQGAIDVAAIINRIRKVPYSLEIPNLERAARVGYEEHARLCCAHAREYVASHPRCQALDMKAAGS
jgi:sugar phosphate isomerase/epimerase